MILRETYDNMYDNLKITTLLAVLRQKFETKMCIGWQIITCCFKRKHFILVFLVLWLRNLSLKCHQTSLVI